MAIVSPKTYQSHIMFSSLAPVLLLISGIWIYVLHARNARLQKSLQKYSNIISQEDFEANLVQEISSKQRHEVYLREECSVLEARVKELKKEISSLIKEAEIQKISSKQQHEAYLREECSVLETRVKELKREVSFLSEEAEIQTFGFYESVYNFISSDDYLNQLKVVRSQQKEMIKKDMAVGCPVGWTVGDSKKEGEKLVKNFKKLLLVIFNAECDELIKAIKPGKITTAKSKIEKKFCSLNKISDVIKCSISHEYLILKIRELELQYEFECKRQDELEVANQIKKEKQDREKIQKAEDRIRDAEEREAIYQQKIDEIQQQLMSEHQQQLALTEAEKKSLQTEIENLKVSLIDTQAERQEAEIQSRKYKSGYIFVISNIGSFGRDVYRICLTTSADEDRYVSNMNPIVPFPFDIHFKFFSEDVRETLRLLHEEFQDRRLNKANPRREFFRASFDDIKQAIELVRKNTGVLKNFAVEEKAPNAYEYRKTQQQEQSMNQEKVA